MATTKRHIIFTGLANLLYKTARIADQLLLVPFFLSIWGAAYYGEWLTLSAIPSILAFADLGFGSATSNAFVLNYSGGNKQLSANYFSTGLKLVTISVVLGILLTVIAVTIAWWAGWLDKSLIEPSDVILSITFLMATQFVRFYIQVFEAFYRTTHKAALSYTFRTVENYLRIGAGVLVLVLGFGVVAYSFWQFLVVFVFNIFYAIYGMNLIKDLPKGKWDKPIAIETLKKGLGFLANPIAQSVYYQGSTFIVRFFIGPEAVAMFNTVRTLSRSVNQMLIIVTHAIFPEMQIAIGEGNMKKARQIFSKASQIVLSISVLGVSCLLIFGRQLYKWWTNNQLDVPNALWYIFMIGLLFNAVWWTSETVFRSMNKPGVFAKYIISCSIISLLISLVLVKPFDLVGVAVGYEALDVLMPILVFPLSCKMLGTNWKSLLFGKL